MARKQPFLNAVWSERFKESYAGLSLEKQSACDGAILALIKQQLSAGLRVKPILPDKYYWEARLSSGDRIVYRIEAGVLLFIDVVKHDDIARYGRKR